MLVNQWPLTLYMGDNHNTLNISKYDTCNNFESDEKSHTIFWTGKHEVWNTSAYMQFLWLVIKPRSTRLSWTLATFITIKAISQLMMLLACYVQDISESIYTSSTTEFEYKDNFHSATTFLYCRFSYSVCTKMHTFGYG